MYVNIMCWRYIKGVEIVKREQTVYNLLETIGEAFMIEILENENIRDDVFDILEGTIINDLEMILEKIKYYKRVSEK